MAPRKPSTSRRKPSRQPEPVAPEPAHKTSGVTEADFVRVLSRRGSGIFRDGMTVGEFLRAVPSRDAGLRLLARCRRAGTVAFEQATIESEIAAAQDEVAP